MIQFVLFKYNNKDISYYGFYNPDEKLRTSLESHEDFNNLCNFITFIKNKKYVIKHSIKEYLNPVRYPVDFRYLKIHKIISEYDTTDYDYIINNIIENFPEEML